jgi:hypothetical protein
MLTIGTLPEMVTKLFFSFAYAVHVHVVCIRVFHVHVHFYVDVRVFVTRVTIEKF